MRIVGSRIAVRAEHIAKHVRYSPRKCAIARSLRDAFPSIEWYVTVERAVGGPACRPNGQVFVEFPVRVQKAICQLDAGGVVWPFSWVIEEATLRSMKA